MTVMRLVLVGFAFMFQGVLIQAADPPAKVQKAACDCGPGCECSYLFVKADTAAPPQDSDIKWSFDKRITNLEKRVDTIDEKLAWLAANKVQTTTNVRDQEMGYGGEKEWKRMYDKVKRTGWANFWVGLGTSGYVDAYFPAGFKGLEKGMYRATCYGSEGEPYIQREENQQVMPRMTPRTTVTTSVPVVTQPPFARVATTPVTTVQTAVPSSYGYPAVQEGVATFTPVRGVELFGSTSGGGCSGAGCAAATRTGIFGGGGLFGRRNRP